MYTPGFLVSNASRFLDYKWVDLPVLKYFLETPATYDPNTTSTRTGLSAADRRLLDPISVRAKGDQIPGLSLVEAVET